MIDHKHILRNFSDHPITINTIKGNGFDIESHDLIKSFLWLESEKLIRPLSESSCGLRVDSLGGPCWATVDIVITQKGKDYLHPIRKMLLEPLIVDTFRYLLVAIISFIIGVCSPYIFQLLSKPQPNTQRQTQEAQNKKASISGSEKSQNQ